MRRLIVLLLFMGGFGAAWTTPAAADLIYQLTIDDCVSICGPQASFGSVTLSQNGANTVSVVVALNNSNVFTDFGTGESLAFNVAGNPDLSITGLTSGFAVGNDNSGQSLSTEAGNFQYWIDCNCGWNSRSGPLAFDVSAPNLTPGSLITNSVGLFFVVDLKSGANNKYGDIASNVDTNTDAVPEPTSLLMFGTALLALAMLARRGRSMRRASRPAQTQTAAG